MRKIFIFLLCVFFGIGAHGATLINDTETERLLTTLVAPVATAANISPGRLKIHIVHDDDFNAFVSGGEDVYIYTGLLTQIKSPAALQAVVAHELGHTIGGHMVQMSQRMAAEMRRALLIQALGIGLMAAGGEPSLGAGVLAGAGGVATQGMLSFSRDEERMADNLGLDLMRRANQDPAAFVQVFEQMRDITGAAEAKINPNRVNHPLTAERLKNVREYIAAHPGKYQSSNSKYADEYELVRAKLVGYLDAPARIKALYPASDNSSAALYARAISDMRLGKYKDAAAGVKKLTSRMPDNGYFYELLGDIEFAAGDYDAAVAAYESALRHVPDAPQIQTALALVLTERAAPGDNERARELCLRANLTSPGALTYWALARGYGSDARANWALAEYYSFMGNDKKARSYAKKAQKSLPHDTPEFIKSGDILRKK